MSRFFSKLLASIVASIVLTAAVVGLLEARRIDDSVRRATEEMLRAQTVLLAESSAPVLARGEVDPRFSQRLAELGEASAVRYTVIAADGRVLADSAGDPTSMGNHAARPEILALRGGAEEYSLQRFSETLEFDLIYLARPVVADGQRIGFVRASKPAVSVGNAISELRANMLVGVLIAVLAASILAFVVAQRLAQPVRDMTRVVGTMASGNFAQRIRVDGRDEISELAVACNSLAEQLSQRIEVLGKERQEVVAMLRSMVEGVVATDEQQNIMFINDAALRMLSIENADCVGQKVWRLTPVQGITAILERSISGEIDVADEIRITEAGGDRFFDVRSSPLRSDDDLVRGVVAVFHDVTELRRLEKIRRDFVANVSHELKTPLTAIRGFVETLLDDSDVKKSTRKRFLGKIRAQVDRLSALVSDQLTLAKVESGESPIECRRVDLREVVFASSSLVTEVAEQKRIRLQTDVDAEPVWVDGDPELLRQVVDNLLDNAIKYTPPMGSVAIRLHRDEDDALFQVQDTGIGLSTEDCQRVFERFYRVDRARSREVGGTGLGLSIVRNVTVAHGGRVSVDSELGRGSTFEVRLPLASRAPEPAEKGA